MHRDSWWAPRVVAGLSDLLGLGPSGDPPGAPLRPPVAGAVVILVVWWGEGGTPPAGSWLCRVLAYSWLCCACWVGARSGGVRVAPPWAPGAGGVGRGRTQG